MAWQRKTPFGYMVRGGETVPCPTEADAVQNIFTRYLAGASFGRIAEEMRRASAEGAASGAGGSVSRSGVFAS